MFPEVAVSFKAFLINFTMIPYIFHEPCVDGAYWTMQIEFFFSFVLSAILLFKTFKLKRICLFIWSLVAFILYFAPDIVLIKAIKCILIINYAHMFIMGIVAFLLVKGEWNVTNCSIMIFCIVNQLLYSQSNTYNIFFFSTLIFLLLALQLDLFFKHSKLNYLERTILMCAKISYSWYLIHQMIGYAIIKEFVRHGFESEWIIIIPIVATGIIAFCINRYIEIPTGRYGKQFSNRLNIRAYEK